MPGYQADLLFEQPVEHSRCLTVVRAFDGSLRMIFLETQRRTVDCRHALQSTHTIGKSTMNKDRIVESYRGYEIVAAKQTGTCKGVVWKGREQIHACTGVSLEEIVRDMKDLVDQQHDERFKARTKPPEQEEYIEAFRKILSRLSDSHLAMLKAHFYAPNQTMTATQLANAAGYAGYSSANLQYGTVGKMLNDMLPVELHTRSDGTPVFTSALATAGDRSGEDAHWTWKLRPEVAFAIEQLGLAT